MPDNRPQARQKNVTSGGGNAQRRGQGLGTGPVGAGPGGYSGKGNGSGGGGGRRALLGGGISLPIIIIIVIFFLMGGDPSSLLGGSYEEYGEAEETSQTSQNAAPSGNSDASIYTSANYTTSETLLSQDNGGSVDTSVSSSARDKRTVIKGDGTDVVTVMVYMCGTDLESKSGMASNDLAEMASARLSDNINLIVYTGGCNAWKTRGISSSVNQIYQVRDGGLRRLVEDDGNKPMTKSDTLSGFIRYCAQNFPANRNELILWDHGGGSVSAYGYDEKNKQSGSMSMSGIQKALTDGGVTFDFIGFDTCLMATAETAFVTDDFADYLIASEETEPGIGWYYTNWLTKLSNDPGMPTLEIGKTIIDDFTNACDAKCNGQKTTLSMVDLCEFTAAVPDKLKDFSKSVTNLIETKQYKTVSDARYVTREFAAHSRIDQVDLVNLAENMGTPEGAELAEAIRSAVKYNRTSYNMTNANGIAIYFPYNKKSLLDKAISTHEAIGMDEEYSKCIREAASLQTSGQVASGGGFDPFSVLLGTGTPAQSGGGSSDMIGSLLSSFLTDRSMIPGLDESNTQYYSDRAMPDEEASAYISMHYFDAGNLYWSKNTSGQTVLKLPESQWDLVHDVDLNMFYDDGSGYIDLGLDNVFDFDSEGNLIPDTSGTWIAINGQIVPYYHTSTMTDANGGTVISGYVPVLLNGDRAVLFLTYDSEHPTGYIAGAGQTYEENVTGTVAKNLTALNLGDKLDFICDYYSYDQQYMDSYYIGEQMTVGDEMTVSDCEIGEGNKVITYRITDIYNNEYWTPEVK